jgi:hypothetical protein
MTPEKQVSPAIRILRGERDASARATHLEAATRKFLVTTNERKQMSTTTNFKRIALVAVAALGMGLLSSAPSQAAFSGAAGSQLTITVANGTGSLSKSDTTTAGTVTVTGLALANNDSYSVVTTKKSWPAESTGTNTPDLLLTFIDTATSTEAVIVSKTSNSVALNTTKDSATAVAAATKTGAGANTYVASKWYAFQESATGTRVAGTYVYTIIVTPMGGGTAAGTPQTADITITIAEPASDSLVASQAYSTLFIGDANNDAADEALSVVATASNTAVGYLNLTLKNASNVANARESVTITTTLGLVGNADIKGRSVVLKNTSSPQSYEIYADGSVGVATITVSTPSVTFPTKSITFFAKAAKTITASVATPLLAVGDNAAAVTGVAVDANGNAWTGAARLIASSAADALVAGSVTGSACTYSPTLARHECTVSAIATGTAKFKIIDAATVALATATSNEVTVTVTAATAASVKIEFDKATYAPNERARIYVTPLDSTGKAMQSSTITSLFTAGGISVNGAVSYTGSTTTADSLTATATSLTTAAQTSATSGARAGSMQFTVYMPSAGGVVTLSATGGTGLPLAGRVAVTASATVTDSGAAALAAVNALATTVASLRTLITTLTNLVLKIQKKVKA